MRYKQKNLDLILQRLHEIDRIDGWIHLSFIIEMVLLAIIWINLILTIK